MVMGKVMEMVMEKVMEKVRKIRGIGHASPCEAIVIS
jgi:hypothetical protein